MFYHVSKIAWFFATPSNLLVCLVLAGLVLILMGRATIGFRLATGAAVGLMIAGLQFNALRFIAHDADFAAGGCD